LPGTEGADKTGKKGSQSETTLTRSFLTTLDQRAAEKNNQVPNPKAVTT
jgi:hypothetical protein